MRPFQAWGRATLKVFDGLDSAVTPFYVAPGEVFRWADRIAPALLKMAESSGGRFLASDIAAALVSWRMQLWLVLVGTEIACVMVTEVVEYPRARAMRCIGLVGRRSRRWVHLLEDVERAARDCFGCTIMEAFLPAGMERLLTTDAWEPFHNLWQKVLT